MKWFNFKKSNDIETRGKKKNEIINCVPPRLNVYGPVNSPDLALTNSVVYRGTSILSDSVASIPLEIYRKKNGYWTVDTTNNLHKLFTVKANKRQTIYELLEGIVIQLILLGNAYIYIRRSADEVRELILIYPNCTFYDAIQNKYVITDPYNKINGTVGATNIIHLRHKSIKNLVGDSVVDYCAKTLGIANGVDSESIKSLSNGMRMRGLLSVESSVVGFSEQTDTQLQDIRDNMQAELNSGNDLLTAPSGTKFQAFSQTNRDSQVVDIKQYTLSDLARFMGVSLSKLYITQGSNYQVALQEQISFYEDTLNPLLVKIEKAFKEKLIAENVWDDYKIEFKRITLPYYIEVLKTYEKAIQLGIYSVNDVRLMHNQQPVEDGDNVVISTNLQYVDRPDDSKINE